MAESEQPAGAAVGVDQELVSRLVAQAREQGVELTGQDGLLQQMTKRVLESALEGELADHVGRERHERAGQGAAMSVMVTGPRRPRPGM